MIKFDLYDNVDEVIREAMELVLKSKDNDSRCVAYGFRICGNGMLFKNVERFHCEVSKHCMSLRYIYNGNILVVSWS